MLFSRLRRTQSLIGIGSLVVGLGYFLAEVFTGGIPMTWPFSLGIWISLALIFFGSMLILVGLLKDDSPIEIFRHKFRKAHKITPLLRKMDRYLWQHATKYVVKVLDIEKFMAVAVKVNELLGIETKELDSDETPEIWLKQTKEGIQSSKDFMELKTLDMDAKEQDQLINSIVRLSDSEGYGMKMFKESDRKYIQFKNDIEKLLDNYGDVFDVFLVTLINHHIHLSEYFANSSLLLKRMNWISDVTQIPSFSDIAGADTQARLADLETDSNERLREIRALITEKINESEKAQWIAISSVNSANRAK